MSSYLYIKFTINLTVFLIIIGLNNLYLFNVAKIQIISESLNLIQKKLFSVVKCGCVCRRRSSESSIRCVGADNAWRCVVEAEITPHGLRLQGYILSSNHPFVQLLDGKYQIPVATPDDGAEFEEYSILRIFS